MMVGNYLNAINGNYQTQAKLVEQNATQQLLNRPSDNPVDYCQYLTYVNNDVVNNQYIDNAKNGLSWMKGTDNALTNIVSELRTVVQQSNQAANGTNTLSDNQATAKQLMAIMQQVVDQANTEVGGRYLFAGQKDRTMPFKMSPNTVDRGLAKTLDGPQSAFFGKTVTINGVPTKEPGGLQIGSLNQMLSMTGSDGNTYYLDPSTGYVFSKDFVQNGYKDKLNLGQTQVTAADAVGRIDINTVAVLPAKTAPPILNLPSDAAAVTNFKGSSLTTDQANTFNASVQKGFINKYFDTINGGLTQAGLDLRKTGLATEPAAKDAKGNPLTFSFDTVAQHVVTYMGDDNKISMVKVSGPTNVVCDGVSANGPDVFGNSDIFGTSHGTAVLNDLLTVVAQMNNGNQKWLSSDGIHLANAGHDRVLQEQTALAARNQAYDGTITTMNQQNLVIQQDLNNVNGVNVPKLMTKLITAQTIYNMSLAISKDVLPKSIADYLR